jgi:hypothetical protein
VPYPDSGWFVGLVLYRAWSQPGSQRIAGSPAEWQEAWTVNSDCRRAAKAVRSTVRSTSLCGSTLLICGGGTDASRSPPPFIPPLAKSPPGCTMPPVGVAGPPPYLGRRRQPPPVNESLAKPNKRMASVNPFNSCPGGTVSIPQHRAKQKAASPGRFMKRPI